MNFEGKPKSDSPLDDALEKARREATEREGFAGKVAEGGVGSEKKEELIAEAATERQGGTFQDLASLAEEISKAPAAEAAKEETETEKEKIERLAEAEKWAEDSIRHFDEGAKLDGRFSYFDYAGHQEDLKKEKAVGYSPGVGNPNYHNEYVHLGHHFTEKLAHFANEPKDYLEAYDMAMKDLAMLERQAQRKHEEPVQRDLGTFYKTQERHSVGGWAMPRYHDEKQDPPLESFYKRQVRDFPKEIAYKLYVRGGYVAGHGVDSADGVPFKDLEEGYKRDLALRLEGFSSAALEKGDIETALEGYKRLDKLNDPVVVSGITKALEQMRQSKDPNVRRKLSDTVKKIQELGKDMKV